MTKIKPEVPGGATSDRIVLFSDGLLFRLWAFLVAFKEQLTFYSVCMLKNEWRLAGSQGAIGTQREIGRFQWCLAAWRMEQNSPVAVYLRRIPFVSWHSSHSTHRQSEEEWTCDESMEPGIIWLQGMCCV
ncbi:unnamed protein product, partial [Ostreobium quekettii]